MNELKPIAKLNLSGFPKPSIPGNRGVIFRTVWYFVSLLFFDNALALLPGAAKAVILRAFGAKIGKGFVMKPRVMIKSPWFLSVGDHVWIGERTWIDNHTMVKIGSDVCISQGAYIFTGNHDWSDPSFSFFCKPVEIGDHVWITAFQRVPAGATIPDGHALVDKRA